MGQVNLPSERSLSAVDIGKMWLLNHLTVIESFFSFAYLIFTLVIKWSIIDFKGPLDTKNGGERQFPQGRPAGTAFRMVQIET